jgi:hypothetical protein
LRPQARCLFSIRTFGMAAQPIKQPTTDGVFTVIFAQESNLSKLTKNGTSHRKRHKELVKKADMF